MHSGCKVYIGITDQRMRQRMIGISCRGSTGKCKEALRSRWIYWEVSDLKSIEQHSGIEIYPEKSAAIAFQGEIHQGVEQKSKVG